MNKLCKLWANEISRLSTKDRIQMLESKLSDLSSLLRYAAAISKQGPFYIKKRTNVYVSPLPDSNTLGEPDQALAVGNSQLTLVTDSQEAVVQVSDATRTCDKFTKTR